VPPGTQWAKFARLCARRVVGGEKLAADTIGRAAEVASAESETDSGLEIVSEGKVHERETRRKSMRLIGRAKQAKQAANEWPQVALLVVVVCGVPCWLSSLEAEEVATITGSDPTNALVIYSSLSRA